MSNSLIATATGNLSIGETTATINSAQVNDVIVIGIRYQGAAKTIGSLDCSGETVTLNARDDQSSGGFHLRWGTMVVGTAGNKTVHLAMSDAPTGTAGGIVLLQLRGANVASVIDAINGANGGNVADPTVTLSSLLANDTIIAMLYNESNGNGTPDTANGYAVLTLPDTYFYEEGEYLVDSGAAGSKTVKFINPGTSTYVMSAIAIKTAAGGGGIVKQAANFYRRQRSN